MTNEIDIYMEYLLYEKNCSEKTIKSYNTDLLQFLNFLIDAAKGRNRNSYETEAKTIGDDISIESITKSDIHSFIEFCYDSKMSKASISRKIACLRSFFKFLYMRNIIFQNPARDIHFPKKQKRIPKFLRMNQIDILFDFPDDNFADARDKAILEVFFSTGARISEIVSAHISHIDIHGKSMKVSGKGNRERIVFLTESAVQALKRYFDFRKKIFGECEGPLFINRSGKPLTERGIFYIIDKRAQQKGLFRKVSPHALRHTFATELLNNGADIRAVQEMLGHKHISTTQVYTHTTRERLRKVFETYHPHGKKIF
ncbi:MAG: tyrosine-type recombinase/integrase [Spirochaetes bacterium]|nr:tyrosine-type recombinase/integrase [Spirochaetota bacterium]